MATRKKCIGKSQENCKPPCHSVKKKHSQEYGHCSRSAKKGDNRRTLKILTDLVNLSNRAKQVLNHTEKRKKRSAQRIAAPAVANAEEAEDAEEAEKPLSLIHI